MNHGGIRGVIAAGAAIGGITLAACQNSAGPGDAGSAPTGAVQPAPAPLPPGTDPMTMTFREFDQTPHQGWRALADEERWGDAGKLIDRYLAAHPELPFEGKMILNFHAGQMYGFAGDTSIARNRFMGALIPNENPDALIRWNSYVLATIAFLEHDRETLEVSRDVILGGPTVEGCKPNLNIVNSLLANMGKPYKEAYQASGPPTMK